ncbi:7065_t:CDS:2, partial [Funneliformis geosporum]
KDIFYSVLGLFPTEIERNINFKYKPRLCGGCKVERGIDQELKKCLEEILGICEDYGYNFEEEKKEKCYDAIKELEEKFEEKPLEEINLSALSKFTNLEELYLGNDIEERFEKGIINRFHGKEAIIRKLKLGKEEAEKLRRTNRDNFSVILNDILINYAKKELGLDLTSEQEGEIEKLGSDIATSSQARNTKLEEKLHGSEDKDGKTELTSTSITVAGGALTLLDYSTTGGVITLVAPLIVDADTFLDNYNELLGILKQVQIGETGIVNIALKNLKNEVDSFLKEYDEDGNEEIDIDELTKERKKFSSELIRLEEVAKMMKNLEKEVINYRQGSIKKELETQPQIEVDVSADKHNDNQISLDMKTENM